VRAYLQEAGWFPDTVYRRGLLDHAVPGPAVGRQLPLPWVGTANGEPARLDTDLPPPPFAHRGMYVPSRRRHDP
jgi:hypothetical protein